MKLDYRFLIIDDNVTDQIVTTQLLRKVLDINKVHLASNGKDGIQWLSDNEIATGEFLIILLDIKMPEMNGFEFLYEYENLPDKFQKATQIFMLSSTLDPNDIQKANSNKYVKSLLCKPLPVKEFGKMIYFDN